MRMKSSWFYGPIWKYFFYLSSSDGTRSSFELEEEDANWWTKPMTMVQIYNNNKLYWATHSHFTQEWLLLICIAWREWYIWYNTNMNIVVGYIGNLFGDFEFHPFDRWSDEIWCYCFEYYYHFDDAIIDMWHGNSSTLRIYIYILTFCDDIPYPWNTIRNNNHDYIIMMQFSS